MTEPVFRQQIGYDLAGNPMYAPPVFRGNPENAGQNHFSQTGNMVRPLQQAAGTVAQQATVPLQPIQAHPWGAYLAGGCLGLLALTVVVVLVMFVVFGFAILAAVLGLVVVALTICVLVLKSMWTSSRKG